MDVERSAPDLRLAPYVRSYASRRADLSADPLRIALPARTQVLLEFYFAARHLVETTATGLREFAPTVVVVGPQTHRRVDLLLSGTVDVFTIGFAPTGLHALFGMAMQEVVDTAFAAETLLGGATTRLLYERLAAAPGHAARAAICDAMLLTRTPLSGPSIAARAVAAIQRGSGTASVAQLAAAAAVSPRHLRRLFETEVGITPKLYARIVRLDAALAARRNAPMRSWTDIAHDFGWFDQAHLDKDFRALAGTTPRDFPIRPPMADPY